MYNLLKSYENKNVSLLLNNGMVVGGFIVEVTPDYAILTIKQKVEGRVGTTEKTVEVYVKPDAVVLLQELPVEE